MICFLVTFVHANLFAESKTTAEITINQNPLFGFTPSLELSFPLNDNLVFQPYVEYWVNNSFNDTIGYIFPGLEFGLGLKYSMKKLDITGSLGIYSGNSYSGGGRNVIFDAVVPMLKFNYLLSDEFSLKFKGRAWIQGRLVSNLRYTFDDSELNANLDYKLNEKYDLGLFYSQYIVNKKNQIEHTSSLFTSCIAIGPTFTFKTEKISLLVGYGLDLVDYVYTGIDPSDRVLKDYYQIRANIKL